MPLDRNHLLRVLVAERGPLLGFMFTVCRDRDLAEDMFQNLVVITSKSEPIVESREQFMSWARTTARYGLYNVMRKQRRQIPLTEHVVELLEDEWSATLQNRGSSQIDALEDCLQSLTPNVQELLKLRYDKGLTCEEVAHTLRRKLNAVHVALSRAYRVLAQCIETRLESEGGIHGRTSA